MKARRKDTSRPLALILALAVGVALAIAACAQEEPQPPPPVIIDCQLWPGALVVIEGGDFGTNADWTEDGSAFSAIFALGLPADFHVVQPDGGLMLQVPDGAQTGTLVIDAGSYGTYDVLIEIVAVPGDSIQPATIGYLTCQVPTSGDEGGTGTDGGSTGTVEAE